MSARVSSSCSAADWLLDNFHLITAEIADIRRNLPRTYSRTLPTLASREHAGHARIYAIAVELIRHSDSRLDRQQLDPVPEQLPARRAADDRRAVGVAEHAEARAHREPAPAGRGTAARPRRAPRRRHATSSSADDGARRRRCPRAPIRRSSSSSCTASASTAYACRRFAPPWTTTSRRAHTTAEETIRGEHQRQGDRAGLGGQRRHEPAPVRDARLAGVRRDGQPGRAGAAARSRRRVRTHGLPQPRRSSGRPSKSWRRPSGEGQVRVALKAIESARQAASRRRGDRSRGPRRLSPRRPRARAISKRTSPIVPASGARARVGCCATRPACTSARLRPAPHSCSPRPTPTRGTRAARRRSGCSSRFSCCCRRSDFAIACVQQVGRPPCQPEAAAAPRLLRRRPRQRPHDGHRADDADEHSRGVDALLEHVEVLALGNLDPCVHFAILSDFADTGTADAPGDAGDPRTRARTGVEALNRQVRRGARRPVLPVPSRPPVERARARVDRLGAQARQDRGVQSPAARRHRHELLDAGRRCWTCCRRSATASRSTPTRGCRATPPGGSSASSRIR